MRTVVDLPLLRAELVGRPGSSREYVAEGVLYHAWYSRSRAWQSRFNPDIVIRDPSNGQRWRLQTPAREIAIFQVRGAGERLIVVNLDGVSMRVESVLPPDPIKEARETEALWGIPAAA